MLKQNSPAPLAEISPPFGETSEGDNGPSLRLRVAVGWDHLKRVSKRIEDSLLGDFLALFCLIGSAAGVYFIGWALS